MAISKSDFVKNLLKDKTINAQQREKVFGLVARDFVNSDEILNKIAKDVQDIKKGMSSKPEETIKSLTSKTNLGNIKKSSLRTELNTKTESQKVINVEYLRPQNLTNFLHDYNKNEVLKYTCHKIDSDAMKSICELLKIKNYDFIKHKRLISNEYFKLQDKYKGVINSNIKGKIGEYLNNYKNKNKGWSEDSILITWSSEELVKWSKENPGKCPSPDNLDYNGFEFSPIELNNGTSLNNFRDIVLHFKKQIQFRESNSLKSNLEEVSFEFNETSHFNFDDVRENIEFFTDTEKVKQAFRKIIEMTESYFKETEKTEKPNFKVQLVEDSKLPIIVFSIHNTNSRFGKSLENLKDRLGLGEKTEPLINLINGICDFSITADFGTNEYAEVDVWREQNQVKAIEKFEGVKFNFIFYRSK